jgi:hypothetical protein
MEKEYFFVLFEEEGFVMSGNYRNVIGIIPVYAVEEIKDSQVTIKSGYEADLVRCTHAPHPSEEKGNSTAGVYNWFSLHVYTEGLSSNQKEKYGTQCEVILMLYKKGNTEPLVVGDLQNSVTMIRVQEGQEDLLSFTRSSFMPVL